MSEVHINKRESFHAFAMRKVYPGKFKAAAVMTMVNISAFFTFLQVREMAASGLPERFPTFSLFQLKERCSPRWIAEP